MSKSIEHAESKLATAKSFLRNANEQDLTRKDGSERQDRLHEQHLEKLQADVDQCERDLEEARKP